MDSLFSLLWNPRSRWLEYAFHQSALPEGTSWQSLRVGMRVTFMPKLTSDPAALDLAVDIKFPSRR